MRPLDSQDSGRLLPRRLLQHRMLSRRMVGAVAALAVSAPVVAGCGALGAEGDEDALVIYSGRQEGLVAPLLEDFAAESGIDISVRYGDTAQLAAQILEEGDRTNADVFFAQDGGALGALTEADRLAEIPTDILDLVPDQFQADDGTWVGTSGRARVIVYDPSQISEAELPDSVFDLTDERWRGQVGIAPTNASFQAFVTAMRVITDEQTTQQWLDDIAANDPQIFPNNIAILNAAEDGLIQVGLINHYYWYEQVAEEGLDAVPARLHYLPGDDPGSLINVAGVGVVEGTDQSEAAEQFVEFMLSEQAQTYFRDVTKEYPLVGDIPETADTPDLPPLEELDSPDIDLSQLDDLQTTLDQLAAAGLL